ncbi:hypothetical protein [Acidisphaera sp. S103]|uniref:hypothetical protein n=1 Tax=Acidisphaera sp. S103 TaxID=1747223 RepID=UPI001575C7D8|nr:hypothetical protein [Acidisphaera sp. S103]
MVTAASSKIKGTRVAKWFDFGTAAQFRHSGRRPAIHAFAEASTARRGWRAFARHGDERLAAPAKRKLAVSAKRFGYFAASLNVTTGLFVGGFAG